MSMEDRKQRIYALVKEAHELTLPLFFADEGEWRQLTGTFLSEVEELLAENLGLTKEQFRMKESRNLE